MTIGSNSHTFCDFLTAFSSRLRCVLYLEPLLFLYGLISLSDDNVDDDDDVDDGDLARRKVADEWPIKILYQKKSKSFVHFKLILKHYAKC